MEIPELLAPAGDLEKLKMAVLYGADAVYVGGSQYNLREGARNLTLEELKDGTEFAHRHQARVYLTLNIIPHNDDLASMEEYLKELQGIPVDALIISDPGVFTLIRERLPEMEVHLSTQANTLNWRSASFWEEMGFDRIILARELSFQEIEEIRRHVSISLEAFIHGAMCISYSGRCLLSSYMAGRDPNRGECAQACRWKYYLVEEKRPGEYYPVMESEQGTYVFNSKDLCMVEYLPRFVKAGVNSLKIEGRMKSLHYVATVVGTYRRALDWLVDHQWQEPPEKIKQKWLEELRKVSHRDYTTGFYLGQPGPEAQRYETSSYIRNYNFVGIVRKYRPDTQEAEIEVRNKIVRGDELEIIGPRVEPFAFKVNNIKNEEGENITEAPHPHQRILITVPKEVGPNFLVRKRVAD